MCVAIPMKVVELLEGNRARLEYGGVERSANVRLLDDCRVGDYVLVHAGYAIEKIAPEAAEENLRALEDMKRELGL
ncbi:MAG: HypC/HybG/HupF family hydrogenase formation chaperone [Lentisphaeria bacterium]|nr:HypC/HybG/HupF family hydrogenase formation chaperone [Lentisphaeria bacterium]